MPSHYRMSRPTEVPRILRQPGLHPLARTRKHQARLQFVTWFRKAHPELYRQAMSRTEAWRKRSARATGRPATLEGLGQTKPGVVETQSFWEKLQSGITTLGTTYLTYKTQKDAMEINLARAEDGLPPVDTSFAAPIVRTQIEISPEIAARLQETGGEAMRKMMLFGGLALGAVVIMMGMKR